MKKNTGFRSFQPKQDCTYNVILEGIHNSNPINEIKEELEELGHQIAIISNIRDRISKMVYISLKQVHNNKDIFNWNSLLHTKIKFETCRKWGEIVECTRCQRYGYTKGYCHHNP